jgi:hypothetical protein
MLASESGKEQIAAPLERRAHQPRPPVYTKLHPLEREARRALGITQRMGRRLLYQLRQLDAAEDKAGQERGAAGLPTRDWAHQMALYADTLTRLLTENRRMLALTKGKAGGELEPGDEAEELEAAAELLTDDEWERVAARRAMKDGAAR